MKKMAIKTRGFNIRLFASFSRVYYTKKKKWIRVIGMEEYKPPIRSTSPPVKKEKKRNILFCISCMFLLILVIRLVTIWPK